MIIIAWERNGVLKIPTSSLFRTGDAWAVFAVRDGRAAQTTVEIGRRSSIEAEVLTQLVEDGETPSQTACA